MRLPLFVTCFAAACHPSATVQRTMPVANLQTYHTVSVRVQSVAAPWRGAAQVLDDNLLGRLTQECQFDHVQRGGQADVLVDVNITSMGRGGNGIVKNPGKATLDALLVLTDGASGDLIGTAKIQGESSGVIINNARPENEAIDVVAKSVADLLASSGCTGPRIAKVEPPPPDTHAENPPPPDPGKPPPPPIDETKRPDAEKLNDSGKDKLRSADIQGALADFQQADQMLPDPRYSFNMCLAYEAQEQWDQATTACNKAKSMNPKPELAGKIDSRLGLIQHHQ